MAFRFQFSKWKTDNIVKKCGLHSKGKTDHIKRKTEIGMNDMEMKKERNMRTLEHSSLRKEQIKKGH